MAEKEIDVYIHDSTEELEEIYEDELADLLEHEKENVLVTLNNIKYETEIKIAADLERPGEYRIISVNDKPYGS